MTARELRSDAGSALEEQTFEAVLINGQGDVVERRPWRPAESISFPIVEAGTYHVDVLRTNINPGTVVASTDPERATGGCFIDLRQTPATL